MNLKDAVKPITYLKNHTAEVVRKISENGQPLVITQNGEAKVVVMDVKQYDQWRQTLAMLKIIAMGEAEIARGEVIPLKEAFQRTEEILKRNLPDE
jgi:prevent-host-death family protein